MIEKKWAKYRPIINLTDKKTISTIKNFFSSGNASSSTEESSGVDTGGDGGNGSKVQFAPWEQFVITTADKLLGIKYTNPDNVPPSSLPTLFTTGADGKIDLGEIDSSYSVTTPNSNGIKVDIGLFGYFSCSWGNIEGGAAVAAHVLADTNLVINAGVGAKPTASGSLCGKETPTRISLRLFNSPPIQIGVLSLTFAIDGGVEFPVSLSSSLQMSMETRFAFCGLYGAEVHAGANYGVEWISSKVLWFKVWCPAFYGDLYSDASILNDTAYYVGPSDWVIVKSTTGLESASASISITPTVFIEPKVLFNEVFWIGLKASAGEELKFTLSTKNVPNRWYPDIHGVGTAQLKIDLTAKAGLSVKVPIINYRWEPSFTVPIYSVPTKVYTWNAF